MSDEPDPGLLNALDMAMNIRKSIIDTQRGDLKAAAQIRKASDRILSVADELHFPPLPKLSHFQNWPTAHVTETQRLMLEAVKTWRTAAVAHEHASDLYGLALEANKPDTAGLRQAAENLRAHAAQIVPLDTRYDSPGVQTSIDACNEAIARINEKHALVAARLNDTADRLDARADDYDNPPGPGEPITIHQPPS
ncbi:MAG: hypothetical protein ACRDTI_15340 [Mycobacterium sp.]